MEEIFEGKNFEFTVTRKVFEEITADLYPKYNKIVTSILERNQNIDAIELYGGAQRIPKSVETLKGKKIEISENFLRIFIEAITSDIPVGRHIDGDESPLFGAAYYLAVIQNGNALFTIHL